MKKPIYMFIGGSLFGVVAAVAIIKSTTTTEQVNPIATTNTNAKVITAKMQAEQMKSSDMPMESLSDMQVRLSQQPGTQGQDMMNMQNSNMEEAASSETEIKSTQQVQQKQIASIPATPPTTEQVQQYNDIEKTITSAVNNPRIKLSDLIRQSSSLTIQQRTQLTQKAMDMINRGELNIEQFANNQTATK